MEDDKLYGKPALADARKATGLTGSELSDLVEIKLKDTLTVNMYRLIERGERPVGANIAVLIARILKKDIKELWESR